VTKLDQILLNGNNVALVRRLPSATVPSVVAPPPLCTARASARLTSRAMRSPLTACPPPTRCSSSLVAARTTIEDSDRDGYLLRYRLVVTLSSPPYPVTCRLSAASDHDAYRVVRRLSRTEVRERAGQARCGSDRPRWVTTSHLGTGPSSRSSIAVRQRKPPRAARAMLSRSRSAARGRIGTALDRPWGRCVLRYRCVCFLGGGGRVCQQCAGA